MIGLIRGGLAPERVITHRFNHAEAEEAFRVYREGQCGKVIFLWQRG